LLSALDVEPDTRDDSPGFQASIRSGCGVTVVCLAGELDLASAPQVQTTLQGALELGARSVVIDLSRVTFIDARGIGLIVGARRSATQRGATLGVSGVEGQVAQVFALAGLGELIVVDARESNGGPDGHR
jgi:anti-sigma B factor antagonist